MSFKTRLLLIVSLLSLIGAGCKENDIVLDFDDTSDNRTIELAGPFAQVNITAIEWLEEEFEEEEFKVGTDGLISISYTHEVFLEWESLVEIQDFSGSFALPTQKEEAPLVYAQKIKFNPSADVRYDSLTMAAGLFEYAIEAPSGTTGTITFAIPELITDGLPYEKVLNVTTNNRVFNISEDLSGSRVHFSQETASSYVTLSITIDLTPTNPLTIPGLANVQIALTGIDPEITFGYFGQKQKEEPDATLTFSLFDELELLNEIEFSGLSLDVVSTNSIGTPFKVNTSNIRLYKENDPVNYDLLEINGTNYIEMDVAPAIYGSPVIPGINSYNINEDNSNIHTLGNRYPDKLVCDITAWSNPDGETDQNFIGNATQLETDLKINIPFWFKTALYARKDTIEFDFNDMIGEDQEELEKIEYFDLYFDFYNKFPFEMLANAWVVNASDQVIETLFSGDEQVIASGVPGDDGKIIKATHTEFVISVSNEQIRRFISEKAMNIILETKASTYNEGTEFVKVFDQSELDVNISINAKTRIP